MLNFIEILYIVANILNTVYYYPQIKNVLKNLSLGIGNRHLKSEINQLALKFVMIAYAYNINAKLIFFFGMLDFLARLLLILVCLKSKNTTTIKEIIWRKKKNKNTGSQ